MVNHHRSLRPSSTLPNLELGTSSFSRTSLSNCLLTKRRRVGVSTACNACRRRKARCNGKRPCQRCNESGNICEYHYGGREKIKELRAEIGRLKGSSGDNDKVIRASLPSQDSNASQTILEGSINEGHVSDKDQTESFEGTSNVDLISLNDATSRREPASLRSFSQLLSWKYCPYDSNRSLLPETSGQSSILSLPRLPPDTYSSPSQTDSWTQTGWTKAYIRHLFDVLLTWDYLSMSLLCEDEFLEDFQNGSGQFCSSALVHAILALACQLIDEDNDDTRLLSSGWIGSGTLFEQTEVILQANGPFYSLADCQALGILSLYHLRCGREAEAHELAGAFATSIAELCEREPSVGKEENRYFEVRATSYCGAVFLSRMLHITTGLLFNIPSHTLQGGLLNLENLSHNSIGNSQGCSNAGANPLASARSPQQYNLQLIMVNIFQLTEWVFKLITLARSAPSLASNKASVVYMRCLEWYESFFALLNRNGDGSPFLLFVHMYYHFCLFSAFRPFLGNTPGNFDIVPPDICAQAAQSILSLAQSYDDLFTLRRVSASVPYFVCAAGLYNIGMKNSGSAMSIIHLRGGDNIQPGINIKPKKDKTIPYGVAATPSHITMSAVGHALLLLEKMASNQPVVRTAEKMLFERA